MEKIIIYWPIVLFGFGVFVWLIRNEGKTNKNTADIETIKQSQEKNIDKLTDKIEKVDIRIGALSDKISELTGYLKRCEEDK